jgi:hypothetical protein
MEPLWVVDDQNGTALTDRACAWLAILGVFVNSSFFLTAWLFR